MGMSEQQAGQDQVVYFQIDDGGAIARETAGWNREVWLPQEGQWVKAGDMNFATDAREIPADQAQQIMSEDTGFGDFAPEVPAGAEQDEQGEMG